jgi:hypothetical protein
MFAISITIGTMFTVSITIKIAKTIYIMLIAHPDLSFLSQG